MAVIKPKVGPYARIDTTNTPLSEGTMYFTYDEDGAYVDIRDEESTLFRSRLGESKFLYYGTCSTVAAAQNKVVTCNAFNLVTGARIAILFDNANSAETPMLNVNGTGSIAIIRDNDELTDYNEAVANEETPELAITWEANSLMIFVYTGSFWQLVGGVTENAKNKITSITSSSTDMQYPSGKAVYDLVSSYKGAYTWGQIKYGPSYSA